LSLLLVGVVMSNRGESAATPPRCECKVGRTITRYGLEGINDELVAAWTSRGEQRSSTRELATFLNEQVLAAAFDEAGLSYKDGEIENTLRLLTDEDVSSGMRVQARNELQRDGLEIERVEQDLVSHQTVYNHLTGCLDRSIEPPSDEERLERGRAKIGALQGRTALVTEETIARLDEAGVIDVGNANVTVSVTVTCEDCLQEHTVRELLDERTCDCQ
jgi:hypothetical protein